MKLDTFFARNAVFTVGDIDRYLSAEEAGNPETRDALLRYHQERGRIVRVRRGLYASVPLGSDPASFPVDPLLVASRLCDDAVLAYHTALDFHGIAQSQHNLYTVLSAQPLVRDVSFQGADSTV
jgi:predicted transcriptional regulator of viral defense system